MKNSLKIAFFVLFTYNAAQAQLSYKVLEEQEQATSISLNHLQKTSSNFLNKGRNWYVSKAVSYTHLTLPTTPYV